MSAGFRPSNFLRGTQNNNDEIDNQSLTFSVDPEMHKKLDIKKPRKGEEYSTYELDKMYKYQLDKDIQKIVKVRGSFQEKNKKFLEIRQSDPDFDRLVRSKQLGDGADFRELLQYTSRISWQATTKPYGEIAHKRYLEYLANLPKGPTEEEIKDKEQRKRDQELWTKVITGRLEPTRREHRQLEQAQERAALRSKGRLMEYGDEIDLTREEIRAIHINNAEFEEIRVLPTRREFERSMGQWHKGVHFPYSLEKGFPYVRCQDRDEVLEDERDGEDRNKKYHSGNILKGLDKNERRYAKHLGERDYEKAAAYLRKHKAKLEKAENANEEEKQEEQKQRRRRGLQGVQIASPLADEKLAQAKERLSSPGKEREEGKNMSHAYINDDDGEEEEEGAGREGEEKQVEEGEEEDGWEHFSLPISLPLFSLPSFSLFSRSGRYKDNRVLPEGAKQEKKRRRRRVLSLRDNPAMKFLSHTGQSLSTLYSILYQGERYKSPTQMEQEQTLLHLQHLLDTICSDSFLDSLCELNSTELKTAEYIDKMEKKRKDFYVHILRAEKRKHPSKETKGEIERLKIRLELFEQANHERLQRQEAAHREIEAMKDILLEYERKVVQREETMRERATRAILTRLAKKIKTRKRVDGKKLAHLLPPLGEDCHAIAEEIFKKRIVERKKEHKQRLRLARLTGMDYSNNGLSRKTADDLVFAAEAGAYKDVIDLLDRRESLDEIDPDSIVSVNTLSTDGATAIFAVLYTIMKKEMLTDDIDYEALGLTTWQRFVRNVMRAATNATTPAPRFDLVVQILLAYGAQLNSYKIMYDRDAMAIVHYAAREGSTELLEWLLDRDVDVNYPTRSQKKTPLMIAIESDQLETAMVLLKHGAVSGIHFLDVDGNNVLHYGARYASPTLLKVLLLCGARPHIRNKVGLLPAELARTFNKFQSSAMISSYKGDDKVDASRISILYSTEYLKESISMSDKTGSLGDEDVKITIDEEGGLSERALMKRYASMKANRMWKQQLETSSKLINKPIVSAPSVSMKSKSSIEIERKEVGKKKRGLLQKSFIQAK